LLELQEYRFAQQSYTSLISLYPAVVLRADNGNKLRTTALAAENEGIATNLFATSMVSESAAEQIAATKAVQLSDAEIVAISLFGEAERLEPLTRRFSLFR
jgi:response regulator RpfG family c-di-GMP phosphodiesterase